MNILLSVPIESVVSLTSEQAIIVIRAIFRAECGYAKLAPSALTISSRLTTPDGGIDAEVNTSNLQTLPSDCIFQSGITGFQIKSGSSFKPWTPSAIRKELLNIKGELYPEVARLVDKKGRYTIICTGHDLTPEQRNDAKEIIKAVLDEKGFPDFEGKIEVLGASQIVEFAERYPGVASQLTSDRIQEALTIEEWQLDAHMTGSFEESTEQADVIFKIRANLQGESKHIRLLGEPGLGKTRIVLESVKAESIAPYVLYIRHGSQFGQTKLFRQLLKSRDNKPLVLIIDELPESELSDIWRHLKPRCGQLKIVSMDHGRDETFDEEIYRLNAPSLPDNTIKKILAHSVGESSELDRWVEICEGSPRVAQAVADNLRANPSDLLKPPATIPLWTRFLHGYGSRDEPSARQIDCVTHHLALFSRFGYEAPVGEEAIYISQLISNIDPNIGWARFQEIVQDLRARRVLQGSRTLFFVPKALHIYLWKQYWERYGRGFDFAKIFSSMPDSLHVWFMNMFKYADETGTGQVLEKILSSSGIFSQDDFLVSDKGSRFLSILAEASPAAVLRILESTIGKWTDELLLELKENRQQFVWTLEKIAVWPNYAVRAMNLLTRLAANENSSNSNNSKGTLLGLFRIGPEWAATESSPNTRLPVFLKLLRSQNDTERRLGLEAAAASLDTRGSGFRIIGPEYQGLKERAKLWIPQTYGDWWQAQLGYFHALVEETKNWPPHLRIEVCSALLNAVEKQLQSPPCTELAFQVLGRLISDNSMLPKELNNFFWNWREYNDDGNHPEIKKKLQILERRYTRHDLASRFNRYVLDVDWIEWDGERRVKTGKARSRAKTLVKALAKRIAQSPEKFKEIQHLLSPKNNAQGLRYFGEQLAQNDANKLFLPLLIEITLEYLESTCLYGYLSEIGKSNGDLYISTLGSLLDSPRSSWLGAQIVLNSAYNDDLFRKCLFALDNGWLSLDQFNVLRYGRLIEDIPKNRIESLFQKINSFKSRESAFLMVELLDSISFDETSPVNSIFVFEVISRSITSLEDRNEMSSYCWKRVCQKLIAWDTNYVLPLLEVLLNEMGNDYSLSYDSNIEPLANELVRANPLGSWGIIKNHFENALPKWRFDILNWLKGGMSGFGESDERCVIADLPIQEILNWIDESPESRSAIIAHAAPKTLDDINGGNLTRELLRKYGQYEVVRDGISSIFRSGGYVGPASAYLKRKREKFRQWLSQGFDFEVSQWVESEIEYLDRQIDREEIDEERHRFD